MDGYLGQRRWGDDTLYAVGVQEGITDAYQAPDAVKVHHWYPGGGHKVKREHYDLSMHDT
jgi:hypothetical protein